MDIADIRELRDQPNPDATRIMSICLRELLRRPETDGLHAEILFYYAEASSALNQLFSDSVSLADRAADLAATAGDFLLATKARCLGLTLLCRSRVLRRETIVEYFDLLRRRVEQEWGQGMDADQRREADHLLRNLGRGLNRAFESA